MALRSPAVAVSGAATVRALVRNHLPRSRLTDPTVRRDSLHGLDVTDLHRMESERQVISDIVHALNQTANLDSFSTAFNVALKRILSAENCFVALHNPPGRRLRIPFFRRRIRHGSRPAKVDRSCTAYVFPHRKSKVNPAIGFRPAAALGEVELVGSPSPAWLGVPLKAHRHHRRPGGAALPERKHLRRARLGVPRPVGGHIALAIERRRAEEELRKNESMLSLPVRTQSASHVALRRGVPRFLRVNQAAVGQYGYSGDEFKTHEYP